MKKIITISLLAMCFMSLVSHAQPQVKDGSMVYTIWGDAASVRCINPNVRDVIIPSTISYQGRTIGVGELGFDCFSGCEGLRTIVVKSPGISILRGALRNCPSLREIIFTDAPNVGIGNSQWRTNIYEVFDREHFSNVTIKVNDVQSFRQSEWRAFRNIVKNGPGNSGSSSSSGSAVSGKPQWLQGWFYAFTDTWGHYVAYFSPNGRRFVQFVEGSIETGHYDYSNGVVYITYDKVGGDASYRVVKGQRKLDMVFERNTFLVPADPQKIAIIVDPRYMRQIEQYCNE